MPLHGLGVCSGGFVSRKVFAAERRWAPTGFATRSHLRQPGSGLGEGGFARALLHRSGEGGFVRKDEDG